jgi:mannose-6-phosphate isomerase
MSAPLLPVVFAPLFKQKPWGGQRLAALLDKRLPAGERIGESWELVSLPGNESRVRAGPLAGRTLGELVQRWGADLLGDAPLRDGRFPLLIKFLDASENLSVQVHPKPDGRDGPPGVKHEAWYVVHADPGAKLYIGLKPGVGPADVGRVVDTGAMVDVLRAWDARPGQCYYLPSGTLHALGAGLVVAEIQTPSDVTYRADDWGRVDAAGRSREMHVAQALQNIRYDFTDAMFAPRPMRCAGAAGFRTCLMQCERFGLDLLENTIDELLSPPGAMRVWIVLAGSVEITCDPLVCRFRRGDVVLIPARCSHLHAEPAVEWRCIEVTVPNQAAPAGGA